MRDLVTKAEIINQILEDNQIVENQAPMAAYQKNQFKFWGIKSVRRRELTKDILKEAKLKTKESGEIDWQMVNSLWQMDARENQYVAADYLNAVDNYLTVKDLEKLEILITTKSWWDSVDVLVKRVGNIMHHDPKAKELIYCWGQSENIWLKRTAIICQLGLKKVTDLEVLSEMIEMNLASQEFFVNKAIGWALREYAKTDPDWVQQFVVEHQKVLHPLSIREALKN